MAEPGEAVRGTAESIMSRPGTWIFASLYRSDRVDPRGLDLMISETIFEVLLSDDAVLVPDHSDFDRLELS
jgi:hypothetical protein